MKRIIALSSFLFLLLMTVLPAGVSHAATANNNAVKLTGISFILENGEKINAVGNGNNFSLDLVGNHDLGKKIVEKVEITSNSAVTLSVLPSDFDYRLVYPLTKDEFDIHFVNGMAVLDSEKVINWANRVNALVGNVEIPQEAPNPLPTLEDYKTYILPIFAEFTSEQLGNSVESPYVFPGFVVDKDGNESSATLTIITKGWKSVSKKWYYFDEFGDFQTDWLLDNGKWYYLDLASGAMKTGWVKDAGKWYYLNQTTGAMAVGPLKYNGKLYVLGQSGAMLAGQGWVKDGNKWYFISGEVAKTGWVYSGKNWYYLDQVSGAMKTGWVQVGKKWYYLYSSGEMAYSTKIGSYKLGKDGAWIK